MKSNSYNRAIIVSLLMVTIVLGALLWPTIGRSQSSSRRDRFRRDMSSRFSPSRTERAPRQASDSKSLATKPVEPNAAGAIPGAAAKPGGAKAAAAPRVDEIVVPMESLADEESGPWARYNVIFQRNIFSRQRTPFRPRDRSRESQVVAPNPETHFILRGLVQEDSQVIAFIEDTQGGGVLRLRQGDRVARGAIKTLSLDTLEYQLEDKTISIRLGCDLEGTRAPVAVAAVTMDEVPIVSQTPAPASTAAPAGQQTQTQPQTPAPAGNEAEILKRLMEQRRQQLGQ